MVSIRLKRLGGFFRQGYFWRVKNCLEMRGGLYQPWEIIGEVAAAGPNQGGSLASPEVSASGEPHLRPARLSVKTNTRFEPLARGATAMDCLIFHAFSSGAIASHCKRLR